MAVKPNERWLDRIIAGAVAAALAGAVLKLYDRSLEAERWRGMIEERVHRVVEIVERIDRRLDEAP